VAQLGGAVAPSSAHFTPAKRCNHQVPAGKMASRPRSTGRPSIFLTNQEISLSSCRRERVEYVDARADDILHVARDERQVVYLCCRGQQAVDDWQATPSIEPSPLVCGRGVHRQHAIRMRLHQLVEPVFEDRGGTGIALPDCLDPAANLTCD